MFTIFGTLGELNHLLQHRHGRWTAEYMRVNGWIDARGTSLTSAGVLKPTSNPKHHAQLLGGQPLNWVRFANLVFLVVFPSEAKQTSNRPVPSGSRAARVSINLEQIRQRTSDGFR
jgi:hypothetical protein